MDAQTLTSLISSLGFPIVACVYLAISNEKLRSTIDGLKDTLSENTKVIALLKDSIVREEKENERKHNDI